MGIEEEIVRTLLSTSLTSGRQTGRTTRMLNAVLDAIDELPYDNRDYVCLVLYAPNERIMAWNMIKLIDTARIRGALIVKKIGNYVVIEWKTGKKARVYFLSKKLSNLERLLIDIGPDREFSDHTCFERPFIK